MPQNRNVFFKISGMDSLGQGVSKEGDKITFVSKAMLGDEGEAEIISQKKGVAFGKISSFSKESELRVTPICPHFKQCPSCHYLHTSYEQELKFKSENLTRMFRKFNPPAVKVIPAVRRLGYRNRIQLHYDVEKKAMGMLDATSGNILPIPECLIGLPPLLKELKRLYENNLWLKEVPKGPSRGHLEIYWMNDELKRSWNKPYSEGGFTQVFEEMNQLLKIEIQNWARAKKLDQILDLFAGNGNLTNDLSYSRRLCVDLYDKKPGEDFLSQNLYGDDALKTVQAQLLQKNLRPETLLLDPPRSGLKNILAWVTALRPQSIVYVSCDPHTLVRDIAQLTEYTIDQLFLFDFFPSTFHFETLIFLERK
jgi:23S rRNA (uracil1939-C5)-methyltransferase